MLQVATALQNRSSSAAAAAKNASGLLVVPKVLQKAVAMLQHVLAAETKAISDAQSSIAEAGVVLWEPGFSIQHTIHVLMPTHTHSKVLALSVVAAAAVAIGWMTFWLLGSFNFQTSAFRVAMLSFSFTVLSCGMNVVSKSLVLTLYSPLLISAWQMSMTATASMLVSKGHFEGSRREMLNWTPVPLLHLGVVLSFYLSFQYLSLSVLMVFKCLEPLVVLALETCSSPADRRPYVSQQMLWALALTAGSSIVYCCRAEVSAQGILYASLHSCLVFAERTAAALLRKTHCQGLSRETGTLLNNLMGLPAALATAHFLGDLGTADWQVWLASQSSILLIVSGTVGSLIGLPALALQREVSASHFMTLQLVGRIAVVALGVGVFHDPFASIFEIIGLPFCFLGSFLYGRALCRSKSQPNCNIPLQRPKDISHQLFGASTKYARPN